MVGTSGRRLQADRRTAFASSLRKDSDATVAVEEEPTDAQAEVAANDAVEEAAAVDAPETEATAEASADTDEAAVEDADENTKDD